MKLITGYDKEARLILCVFARKHEKQNRQLQIAVRFIVDKIVCGNAMR
jgi:hypothetical protein